MQSQCYSDPRRAWWVKDIQRLTSCIATSGRFISKSAERCILFFKTLKTSRKIFFWNEECSKAWGDLKDYLSRLPLLSAPVTGEVFYIYLSTSQQSVASILVRDLEGSQVPVYFISRILRDAKVCYSQIEKLVYALVVSTCKLCAYFESHAVIIYTNHPLE